MSANRVQSARNGLFIEIPTQARGVIHRFATPGDNELIFNKISPSKINAGKRASAKPVILGDDAPKEARE
jgi:hypothetical protein